MSDALDYLLKARPEAMSAYFTFLKAAGNHLDPRTRDLISIITKVYVQTEPGFRQYLMRALRNGASPHEIIDALLLAFPALGLAKIIWATNILLEMDIPEFRLEILDRKPDWHEVGPVERFAPGVTECLDCDGRHLFIYRNDQSFRIYDSRCPHQVTDIPKLALQGEELTCPKHGWVFDIKTGKCLKKGKHPLKEFRHKIENAHLYAYF